MSAATAQVCIALVMLLALVCTLWSKLAGRVSAPEDGEIEQVPGEAASSFPGSGDVSPAGQKPYRERVRRSYDRLFRHWLNQDTAAATPPEDQKAA